MSQLTQSLRSQSLKAESRRPRRIGQGRDPPVVLVMAAVEGDLLDALGNRPLSDGLADRLGRLLVAAVLDLRSQVGVLRARRDQRLAAVVVDDLARQVFVTAIDHQPRPLGRATNPFANAELPPRSLTTQVSVLVHD